MVAELYQEKVHGQGAVRHSRANSKHSVILDVWQSIDKLPCYEVGADLVPSWAGFWGGERASSAGKTGMDGPRPLTAMDNRI